MNHIFVIEDDANIRELIKFALESYQYTVSDFETAEEALEALKTTVPDMMLVDIMLPGIDGITAVKRVRQNDKTKGIPVMMLTAKDAEIDKVMGLDSGADDYMTKPFGIMELSARVRALLRRSGAQAPQERKIIDLGNIHIDRGSREVFENGKHIELTYKEYELLTLLIDRSPDAVTREEIMESIWGYDFIGESRTLDIHISSLRQKMGETGKQIRTVRSVGYRFSKE